MPNTYTMTQIARKMLENNLDFGRYDAIASGSATTMVVTALAVGQMPSSVYENWWAVRREAASQPADREQLVTGYSSTTGTLTVGTMADTTFTNESVELLKPGLSPRNMDLAINWALNYLKREDTVVLPAIQGETRYPLGMLASHARYPNDVTGVAVSTAPLFGRNRELQQWNTYSSTGVLTPPDGFVVAGAAGTATRSTTQTWRKPFSVALTRAGTDVTLTQTVGILPNGVDADSLQGETVTVFGRVWASVAARAKLFVFDGTTTTYSNVHTGSSTWEECSVTVTLPTTATTLTFGATVVTGDTTAYIGEIDMGRGELTDTMRRNNYQSQRSYLGINDYRYDQSVNVLELNNSYAHGQLLISTRRPYPQWPSAAVILGTADAFITDAPIESVAIVATWKVYESLGDKVKAAEWEVKAEKAAGHHLHQPQSSTGVVLPFAFATPARRWGRW